MLAFDCRREIHRTINIIYKMFNFVFGKLNPAAVRNIVRVCGKKQWLGLFVCPATEPSLLDDKKKQKTNTGKVHGCSG